MDNKKKAEKVFSTKAQKIASVEALRYNCEHGLFTRAAHLKDRFNVSNTISKLLAEGIIIENGVKHKYKWMTDKTPETIVEAIWNTHGSTGKEIGKIVGGATDKQQDIALLPTPHAEPVVEKPAKAPVSKVTNVEQEIRSCLDRCKEYGISNQAKYIADHLRHLRAV
jgi:hypothetical protein